MQFIHLSYLQQLSELLEDKTKSQAARLGFIAKQIQEKHVIHINGADTPKLRRCKACHGPITCDDVINKKKNLTIKCSLCGNTKRYIDSKFKPEPVSKSQHKPQNKRKRK